MEHEKQCQEPQRLQERLQLTPRDADEAHWDWDLVTGEVYFAPRWWSMLGYAVDELPATSTLWASFCHPDDAQIFDQTLTQALAGSDEFFQLEYRLRRKQGQYLPVFARAHIRRNAQGKATRLSGFNRDLTAHKWFEAQLHETEGRYRALVEWSPFGVGVHQRGLVVYANPAALSILGARDASELIGTPIMDRVHPDFRQMALERVSTSLSSNTPMAWQAEKLLRMDGSVVQVEIQGTPISHLGEPAIQVTFIDTTARMQSVASLRESEARFRALTELTSDWYWEQDDQCRFIHVSDNYPANGKLATANCIGLKRWELPHTGVSDEQWAQHRRLLQARQTFHEFEMQRPGRDGGWVWVSVSGVPIFDSQGIFQGYWGMGRDITERKNAENSVKESQAQYQYLVEWSSVALSVHQNGRIAYVNPAAMRLWGAARLEELVGTPIEARFHPQYRASTLERLRAMSDKGQHAPMREAKFLKLDGRTIDVETQGLPIQYRGQPAIQISFQDITARKQIENTLRESEDRFRTLTQLSSDWYWEQDENYRFVLLSGDVATGTGLSSQDHIGKTHWDLPALNLSDADWVRHRNALDAHQEFRDFEIRRPDSALRMHWSSVSGTPMFDSHGVFKGYRGIGRDVTIQKQAADQIHRLAFYDALTGLLNRRGFEEQSASCISRPLVSALPVALVLADLDHFKSVNDTHGHAAGDAAIRAFAIACKGSLRRTDLVGRYGGEEFVIFLPGADEVAAEAITTEISRRLAAAPAPDGLEFPTVSYGISSTPIAGSTLAQLIHTADGALYQAKAAGRNRAFTAQ